jgi:phosphoenolpyruvate-protein kinase (PTS system EI component)
VHTLSVSASAIPKLKRFIRSLSMEQCEKTARETLKLDSDVQVAAFLRDRARKSAPHCFEDTVAD